MAFSVMYFPER